MKILFICPDSPSLLLFCRGILSYLKNLSSTSRLDVVVGDSEANEYLKEKEIGSIVIPIYRFFSIKKDLKTFIQLYRTIKQNKYDLVISFTTKPNIYGTLASFFAGTRKIYFHVVGLGSLNISTSSIKTRILKLFLNNLYAVCFKIAEKVWFTNKHNIEYFKEQLSIDPSKVILTKNYLDTNYYSPIDRNDETLKNLRNELCIKHEKTVVMVARMIWSKGIREFVEAAEILNKKYEDIKFILVAPKEPGSPDAVSDSYIEKVRSTENLTWLEFRKDVISFYGISDISVLPTFYQEGGYPRALLEPMSMGKPVITTNNPNTIGAVDHEFNGLIVQERNSSELAAAIEKILYSEKLLLEYGENSRKKAIDEFDEKVIIQEAFQKMGIV